MTRRSVLTATRAELRRLGKTSSPLAASAIVLAMRLDAIETPGSAMAAISKELRVILDTLGATAERAADPVDELRRRREARQRGA